MTSVLRLLSAHSVILSSSGSATPAFWSSARMWTDFISEVSLRRGERSEGSESSERGEGGESRTARVSRSG